MELMPGYKRSDVGVIPEDWDAKPLGSVLSKGRLGGNYANQDAEAELPLMKMGNLARGNFDLSKVQFIKPGVLPEPAHCLVYGDVLFNTRNTLDLVGKVAIWRDEIPVAYYNSNLMRLEFDPNQVCSNEYANYSLNTESAISRLRGLATGTTSVAAIYTRDLLKLQLLVPPLPEQRAIATALSDVDALLASLDQVIAKKRDLKQATMHQLLTGETRLPGFSGEWQLKRLGDVVDTDPENLGADTATDFWFNYISLEDVDRGQLRSHSEQVFIDAPSRARRKLMPNDVLVSTVRPNLQSHLLFKGDAGHWVCSTGFCVIRCREGVTCPAFVFSHFFAADVNRQIDTLLTGSNYPAINSGDVRNLEIMFPSYVEQCAIATVLSEMDAELSALEARRDKTRNIKQAMMQELLTGKTRLV